MSNNITFICHLRKDTDERLKNVQLVHRYYRNIIPNCNFIFVEDDKESFFEFLKNEKNTQYIFDYNTNVYNKCRGYNLGLKNSTTDIVCFLDIDCIVSYENIERAVQQVLADNSINIGYNGSCAYFEYSIKNRIDSTTDINLYNFLDQFVDKTKIYTLYRCADYMIASTRSVGGCLIGKRDTFKHIGGFNPNFIGWGYEDDEIICRARKFNIPMYYVNTDKPLLFHLPHELTPHADKSKHNHYEHNHNEAAKIGKMSLADINEYIKTW